MGSLEVRKIFKIRPVQKLDVFLLGRWIFKTSKNKKSKIKKIIQILFLFTFLKRRIFKPYTNHGGRLRPPHRLRLKKKILVVPLFPLGATKQSIDSALNQVSTKLGY